MTTTAPPINVATLRWSSPEPALWVATQSGEYSGMVEHDQELYVATDAIGQPVGSFRSLRNAQVALGDSDVTDASKELERALMVTAIVAAAVASALGVFGTWVYFS